MALDAPDLVAGRYRKLESIGVGGMARVFLAEDERLGRRVAVKQLHADGPAATAERFEREAKLGALLNHPNLVSIYDITADAETVVIVMEYVEGETLGEAIARGPLTPAKVVSIVHDVAAALNHAHAHGVVHRDVKPGNILLRRDGVTKLADLGIATAAQSTNITKSGMVLGTASYMAPEQLDGQKAGPAADIYALAAVAFEAASGRKARLGETPMEIAHAVVSGPPPDVREAWPEAPAGAAEAIARGMARSPDDRPSSAGEFAADLQRGLRGAGRTSATTSALGGAAAGAAPLAAGGAASTPPSDEPATPPSAEQAARDSTEPRPQGRAGPADGSGPAHGAPPGGTRGWSAGGAAGRAEPEASPARDEPEGSPARDRSPYRSRRSTPSWLPAAAAVALLFVLAVVAFGTLGGGGEGEGGASTDKAGEPKSEEEGGRSGAGEPAQSGSADGEGTGSAPDPGAAPAAGGGSSGSVSGGSPAALNDQGFKLMGQGRYKEAIPPLQKAVAAYPDGSKDLTYAFALFNLGKSLRLAGRPAEAVPLLERRLAIPNQTETVRRELAAARQAAG